MRSQLFLWLLTYQKKTCPSFYTQFVQKKKRTNVVRRCITNSTVCHTYSVQHVPNNDGCARLSSFSDLIVAIIYKIKGVTYFFVRRTELHWNPTKQKRDFYELRSANSITSKAKDDKKVDAGIGLKIVVFQRCGH